MTDAIDVWRRKQMAQTIVDTSDPLEQDYLIRKLYYDIKPLFKKVGDITEDDMKACNDIY